MQISSEWYSFTKCARQFNYFEFVFVFSVKKEVVEQSDDADARKRKLSETSGALDNTMESVPESKEKKKKKKDKEREKVAESEEAPITEETAAVKVN